MSRNTRQISALTTLIFARSTFLRAKRPKHSELSNSNHKEGRREGLCIHFKGLRGHCNPQTRTVFSGSNVARDEVKAVYRECFPSKSFHSRMSGNSGTLWLGEKLCKLRWRWNIWWGRENFNFGFEFFPLNSRSPFLWKWGSLNFIWIELNISCGGIDKDGICLLSQTMFYS